MQKKEEVEYMAKFAGTLIWSFSWVSLLDAVISALGPDAVATSERDLRHIQVLFFLQHLSKRVVIL